MWKKREDRGGGDALSAERAEEQRNSKVLALLLGLLASFVALGCLLNYPGFLSLGNTWRSSALGGKKKARGKSNVGRCAWHWLSAQLTTTVSPFHHPQLSQIPSSLCFLPIAQCWFSSMMCKLRFGIQSHFTLSLAGPQATSLDSLNLFSKWEVLILALPVSREITHVSLSAWSFPQKRSSKK